MVFFTSWVDSMGRSFYTLYLKLAYVKNLFITHFGDREIRSSLLSSLGTLWQGDTIDWF